MTDDLGAEITSDYRSGNKRHPTRVVASRPDFRLWLASAACSLVGRRAVRTYSSSADRLRVRSLGLRQAALNRHKGHYRAHLMAPSRSLVYLT